MPGPVFSDEILADWDDPSQYRAALAGVTPDWVANRLRFVGLKQEINLFVEHVRTRGRDATEFKSSWRNCGVSVEGFAHFAGPTATVFGRTNLIAQARRDRGHRTAVLAVNGSGWLGHRGTAHLELTVRDLKRALICGTAAITAFCWRLIWQDELIPGLAAHLGETGFGSLFSQSMDGNLDCQLVTINDQGAVSLQHMWGY